MRRPPADAAAWSAAGSCFRWRGATLEGGTSREVDVFHVELGDRASPAVLLVHGYPTSSYDFARLAQELSHDHFVCALDTPGYGFSDKPRTGYRYSIFDDARLVDHYVRDVARLERFTLVTHDKGDSVGLALLGLYQEATPRPYTITHHVILNGNVWLPLASLSSIQTRLLSRTTGPALSRVVTASVFAAALGVALYSPRLPRGEMEALASILAYDDGMKVQHEVIQYLAERQTHESAWLDALAKSDIPTTLVWGERDAISPPRVADFVWTRCLATREAPAAYWRVPGANHYVHVDRPDVVATVLRRGPQREAGQGGIEGARLQASVRAKPAY